MKTKKASTAVCARKEEYWETTLEVARKRSGSDKHIAVGEDNREGNTSDDGKRLVKSGTKRMGYTSGMNFAIEEVVRGNEERTARHNHCCGTIAGNGMMLLGRLD